MNSTRVIKHDIMTQLYVTNAKVPKRIAINPDFCDDPFYRYKMHQLIVEMAKGKTFLTNINEIASELKIDPVYIIRYLGSSLGTQVNCGAKNTRAYLSGIFDVNVLSEHIVQFIQEVILCRECGLPELDYIINKDKMLLQCRSCGSCDSLRNRNIPDTLYKYIVLHSQK
jgi:translation initiation factor 2 beta subunit (eIF-2beta)/eIF-5